MNVYKKQSIKCTLKLLFRYKHKWAPELHMVCAYNSFRNRHTVYPFGNFWKIYGFRRGIKYKKKQLGGVTSGLEEQACDFVMFSFSSVLQNVKYIEEDDETVSLSYPRVSTSAWLPQPEASISCIEGVGVRGVHPPIKKNVFSNKIGRSLERVRFTKNYSIIKDQFYPVWNSEKGKKLGSSFPATGSLLSVFNREFSIRTITNRLLQVSSN